MKKTIYPYEKKMVNRQDNASLPRWAWFPMVLDHTHALNLDLNELTRSWLKLLPGAKVS